MTKESCNLIGRDYFEPQLKKQIFPNIQLLLCTILSEKKTINESNFLVKAKKTILEEFLAFFLNWEFPEKFGFVCF